MKKTLTIAKVIQLHQAIEAMKGKNINKSLKWAMMRTREKTLPIFEAVVEIEKPSEALTEFQKARNELIKTHMVAGADISTGRIPLKDPEAFELAIKAIPGYAEAVQEIEETNKASFDRQKEEIEIDIYMADFDTLPDTFEGDAVFTMINDKDKDASKSE